MPDGRVRGQLTRGARIRAILNQVQHAPLRLAEEVALVLAVFAAGDFMETYTDFILLLLYVLVPWTAINLVDFYLVRRGDYDVASFFRADGGRYGRWDLGTLGCYGVGIVVQIPFVSNPLYTGWVARLLGGADVSWIVGLVVVGPLYWVMMRRRGEFGLDAVKRGV